MGRRRELVIVRKQTQKRLLREVRGRDGSTSLDDVLEKPGRSLADLHTLLAEAEAGGRGEEWEASEALRLAEEEVAAGLRDFRRRRDFRLEETYARDEIPEPPRELAATPVRCAAALRTRPTWPTLGFRRRRLLTGLRPD